jgi:hypothetical protein
MQHSRSPLLSCEVPDDTLLSGTLHFPAETIASGSGSCAARFISVFWKPDLLAEYSTLFARPQNLRFFGARRSRRFNRNSTADEGKS